jgi:dTDP-4-dehydrorhamnose 3,5-epimerase
VDSLPRQASPSTNLQLGAKSNTFKGRGNAPLDCVPSPARSMRFLTTRFPGLLVVEPQVYGDKRGWFMESYHRERFADAGIRGDFVQDNHSLSRRGALRGMHFQLRHPQGKLCRVARGEVLDVAVDLRRGSPMFGQHFSARLSGRNRKAIYIPPGFAHGFLTLSAEADFLYQCSDYYHSEDQYGLAWNDPALGIDWGIEQPLVSPRDNEWPSLASLDPEILPLFDS